MTIVLTGRDLDRPAVVRVARDRAPVTLDPAARDRMARTRAIVERALAAGSPIYGTTTGVGVLKRVGVDAGDAAAYAAGMLSHHLVGQGPLVPSDVVRATILRLANHLAEGSPGVRPELAERLIAALASGTMPEVHATGSVGQADLAPLAEIAVWLVADGPVGPAFELEPGEGTALLDNNAVSTAWAALAIADAERLLDTLDVAAALSLDGFAANPSMLDPAIGRVRPYPGLVAALDRLAALLAGSAIHEPGSPRNLQDPLSFRNAPQVLGAARDALAHADAVLAVELNANQGNPIVVDAASGPGGTAGPLGEADRVVSVANFEILPLAAALDHLRIVLASALSVAAERVVKGLYPAWSGLPTGLVPDDGTTHAGLTYLSLAAQSLAVEARLLAAPVSFELTSTAHAEGIEDRTTMAPLAARRLAEQVLLGASIAAIELTVAAQALEVRGHRPGAGSRRAWAAVREHVPFLVTAGRVPPIDGLAEAVRRGAVARAALGDDGVADPGRRGNGDVDRS